MHRSIVGLVMAITATTTAWSQTLIVPAAANAEGANQTRWRTDLQVKAVGDEGATVTLELLETDQNNSQPMSIERTVGEGESLRLGNLLESGFSFTGTAALRVTASSGEVLVTSRTFNDDPGGTYGQTVPAVPVGDATSFGGSATLIQLSRSPDPSTGFRTNIGVVATLDTPLTLKIELYLADGTPIATLTRDLQGYEHRQFNDVFHAAGADDVSDGFAVLRTTSEDSAFISYASVVDNGSGDAVFILGAGERPPEPPEPEQRFVVFESFLRPG